MGLERAGCTRKVFASDATVVLHEATVGHARHRLGRDRACCFAARCRGALATDARPGESRARVAARRLVALMAFGRSAGV